MEIPFPKLLLIIILRVQQTMRWDRTGNSDLKPHESFFDPYKSQNLVYLLPMPHLPEKKKNENKGEDTCHSVPVFSERGETKNKDTSLAMWGDAIV